MLKCLLVKLSEKKETRRKEVSLSRGEIVTEKGRECKHEKERHREGVEEKVEERERERTVKACVVASDSGG